jgi:hypothetical protein
MAQKFFISFNAADRTKTHWIAWTLKEAGHEVAVHDWELPAGGNAPLWMNTKLAWADRLIAVISPDYLPARYSPVEWASEIWNDPDGTKGSVIPVIVRPTPRIPPLLNDLSRIDLTNCSEAEAKSRLIKGVDMPGPPELKPAFEKIVGEPPDSQHVGPAEKPTFPRNDERTFYRRLDQYLTQLDFSVGMLAIYRPNKNDDPNNTLLRGELLRAHINRVESDVKAVCEARPKVSELGDMEILEQLNQVCALFQFGEDNANFTGGASAVFAAQVAKKELLKKLRNDVALKARIPIGRPHK